MDRVSPVRAHFPLRCSRFLHIEDDVNRGSIQDGPVVGYVHTQKIV